MRWIVRTLLGLGVLVILALLTAGIAASWLRIDFVVMPTEEAVLNRERLPAPAFDVMGRRIAAGEVAALQATEAGRRLLSPAAGAVAIDAALIAEGREVFYRETYGNELFLTDVLGILDGALTPWAIGQALLALGGGGTTDLKVALAADVVVGERTFRAGETVSTGLDVPRGEHLPLGIRIFYDRGRVRAGITCALCHASVDRDTGRVVEGAPNADLRFGLILALSANPAAYFAHAGVSQMDRYLTKPDNIVRTQAGPRSLLPEPGELAQELRQTFASWPPGSADTTRDGTADPTQIPSGFVAEAHPYGWSGQAMLGPFRGLASIATDMHGFSVDPTTRAEASPALLGLDPEVYLGIILQGAPDPAFRFDPTTGRKPSELLADADPTPDTPGLTRVLRLANYPRANYVTAGGLLPVRPGEPARRSVDALAAFQMRLLPPTSPQPAPAVVERGRAVFDRAGCSACHSGPALTQNRVWPASVIGTEPGRAKAFARHEATVVPPQILPPDAPVPPPLDTVLVDVPIPEDGQLKLAWAFNRSGGGYKVPGLLGLSRSAPYLHDGGVAVGPDPDRMPGSAALAGAGIAPDPAGSLRALVDRTLRAPVVAANRAARVAGVTGEGHAYWVDREAGFSEQDRDAVVAFLLSRDRLQPPGPGALTPPLRQ